MIAKLKETPRITTDREKNPDEYKSEFLRNLKPSAEAYGALEDTLKEDLAANGVTLPEREEPAAERDHNKFRDC